jgi:hypothetical protein
MVVNTEQQYMAFAVTLLKKNYTKKAEFGRANEIRNSNLNFTAFVYNFAPKIHRYKSRYQKKNN